MEQFKKGEWIVRKWKDEQGGEKDFAKVKFSEIEQGKETLTISQFYRVRNGKIVYSEKQDGFMDRDFDHRLSFQFRSASSIEISQIRRILDDVKQTKKRIKKILQTVNK
jgi:hypothetical protein